MYELLKKYRARLLAIATAFLMVAFLLPIYRGGQTSDPPIGRAYGKKFYLSQMKQAQQNLAMLRQNVETAVMSERGMRVRAPIVFELGETAERASYTVSQLDKYPEMYFLLITEANKMGVYISDDMLRQKYDQVTVSNLDMRRTDIAMRVNEALREFMAVEECYKRMLGAVRVSKPLADYTIATQAQQVQVSAVNFPASDFAKSITPPTQAQLQQQFDKYKDVLPATTTLPAKDNPYNFGYRFPDRARVQYLMLGTEAVRKAVEASRPAKDWSLEARMEYYRNPQPFTTTTQPAGTTKPVATTRPYDEVAQQAKDMVIMREVAKLQPTILSRISSIVTTDWNDYRDSSGKETKSSLGVQYNSYEYLQKLAAEIQKQYNVQLTVGDTGGLMSAVELSKLMPIATSTTGSGVRFSTYATLTEQSRKVLLEQTPSIPQPLALWQPSQAMHDYVEDVFFFRRTAVDPDHSPKDISEVAAKVDADVRTTLEMEKAHQAADEFLKTARADGFLTTAMAQKRPVANSGPMSLSQGVALGLNLSDMGGPQFIAAAMEQLLALRTRGEKMPLAAITVPLDAKVLVTRLDGVESLVATATYLQLVSGAESIVGNRMAAPLVYEWFTFKNVSKRTEFQPANPSTQPSEEAPAPPAGNPLGI